MVENIAREVKKIYTSERYILGKKAQEFKKNCCKFHFIKAIKNLFFILRYNKKNNIFLKKNENEKVLNSLDFKKTKIAIYTCITGNYDKIAEPLFLDKNIDYIIFTNNNINSLNWKRRDIPKELNNLDNILINRYLKTHPFEFLSDYDYVMYIDGNVQVLGDIYKIFNSLSLTYGISMHKHCLRNDVYDEAENCIKYKKGNKKFIKEQMRNYELAGFPHNYGLLEATIIISDTKNEYAKKIFEDWWSEFVNSKSMRDQLALPYILWKKGILVDDIGTLGENEYGNDSFMIFSH